MLAATLLGSAASREHRQAWTGITGVGASVEGREMKERSPVAASAGVITLKSPHSFDETLARLRTAVTKRGLTLFLDLDQQAAAKSDGVAMRRAHLLLFGRPRAGTPILEAVPEAGIDLPLKAYLWEAADSTVSVSYSDPAYVVARHHLPETLSGPLAGVVQIVAEAVAP
jgi:uncharacterized protein (DUF302 family)